MESDEGVFVYHLQKGAHSAEPESPAITFSVTTKVPERTTQSPAEYAAALIDMSQDDGPNSPIQKAETSGLPSLRSEYHFESDKGKMRAVNIAIPNDKTGTLYFFAWQTPARLLRPGRRQHRYRSPRTSMRPAAGRPLSQGPAS